MASRQLAQPRIPTGTRGERLACLCQAITAQEVPGPCQETVPHVTTCKMVNTNHKVLVGASHKLERTAPPSAPAKKGGVLFEFPVVGFVLP